MAWLINAAQLDKFRKNQKNIVILDASLHHDGRDAKQEFAEKHIMDAQFFDIDLFSDPQSKLPHTLIHDEKLIGEIMGKQGIRNDYKIIIYDNSEHHTACRALWMFKMFGHNTQQLYILDGGLKAWEQYGGKVESGTPTITPRSYAAHFQPEYFRSLVQMKANINPVKEQMIDARHPIRFVGGAEPRPHLRSGHIPDSISFPFFTVFDQNGFFKSLEQIKKQMVEVSIELKKPIICYCGSGVTSCVIDFVLDLMNHPQHAVYDGSWTEWGNEELYSGESSLAERPVETCL